MASKHKNKNKVKKQAQPQESEALKKFNADMAVIALNNEEKQNFSAPEEPAKAGSFLANSDWDGYLDHINALIAKRRVVTITLDGQVKPFVEDDQANAIAVLNESYIDQMIKDLKVDSAIQIEVTALPTFFIQGNSLINKNVFSDDQIAMKSRSWHQLPSPKTVGVIKDLEALLPKLKAFKGKIVL